MRSQGSCEHTELGLAAGKISLEAGLEVLFARQHAPSRFWTEEVSDLRNFSNEGFFGHETPTILAPTE